MKDIIGGIIGLIILIILSWWVFNIITDKPNTNFMQQSSTRECDPGYHLENYTTSYGEINDGCFRN